MKRITLDTGKRLKTALAVSAAGIGVLASSLSIAALLGVSTGLPKIIFQSYSSTATEYSRFSQRFSVAAEAVNYLDPDDSAIQFNFIQNSTSNGPKALDINIRVDNNGNLVGGLAGDDLVITGAIDLDGNGSIDVDGVLLTGEVLGFGYQNGGSTDAYDFRFQPTGGLLGPQYSNQAIGVTLTSENSSFDNNFNRSFRGRAKGNVGPIDPTPDIDIEKSTNGVDADDPNAGDAPQINPGDPVSWTYVVTNTGPEDLENVVVTDDQGVAVSCPQNSLLSGESMVCTASGLAEDLESTGFTTVPGMCGSIPNKPLYENMGHVSGEGVVSGEFVEDVDPSHYCNPPEDCKLNVMKTCALPPPPPGNDASCKGKLQSFTMQWDGAANTAISMNAGGGGNDSGGTVNPGDVVTFTGPFSQNDVVVNVGGETSKFHTSCSDDDMDGETSSNRDQQQLPGEVRDCGKNQGDGKHTAGAGGNNEWLLVGFIDDAGDVLNCGTVNPDPGETECVVTPQTTVCDKGNKPDILTFVYTGGACPGSNGQGNKSVCSGTNDSQPVDVILDGSPTIVGVAVGDSFDVPRTGNETFVVLSNAGGSQDNEFHTSCSVPLQPGDSFGAMTLVALDGNGAGTEVEYAFKVTNNGGPTIDNIVVTDNKLGLIGTIPSLAGGDSATLTESAFIVQTTVNIASVTGDGPGGANCPNSNPVTVTVPPIPPAGAKCDGRLQQLTLIWAGADNTEFGTSGDVDNDHPDAFIDNGDEVTLSQSGGGEFDSGDVFADVGAGYSKFHVTCSDHDLDGDSTTNFDSDQVSAAGRDCGKLQGDSKGNGKKGSDPNGINEWLLEGFIDASDDVLDCTP